MQIPITCATIFTLALAIIPSRAAAQGLMSDQTTGAFSLGLSGMKSNDGTTLVADVLWMDRTKNDGVGVRFVRQGLAPKSHGYAAMLVLGGPVTEKLEWLRIDFGIGYVGQQSARKLRLVERHGLGVQFGTTIAPLLSAYVRPELNAWAIVGTSARFLGVSAGLRVLKWR